MATEEKLEILVDLECIPNNIKLAEDSLIKILSDPCIRESPNIKLFFYNYNTMHLRSSYIAYYRLKEILEPMFNTFNIIRFNLNANIITCGLQDRILEDQSGCNNYLVISNAQKIDMILNNKTFKDFEPNLHFIVYDKDSSVVWRPNLYTKGLTGWAYIHLECHPKVIKSHVDSMINSALSCIGYKYDEQIESEKED